MAVARTNLLAPPITSGNAFGTGAYSPSAISVTSGRAVFVVAAAMNLTGTSLGPLMTLADSAGNSWTNIKNTTSEPGGGHGVRAWWASPNATTSTTLSLDCGAQTIENYTLVCFECTGTHASAVGATASGTDADGDGAASITLSGSPASDSLLVAAVMGLRTNSASGTVTPGASWSEQVDTQRTDWWSFQVQEITGVTATNVDWVDLVVGATQSGASMIAFEIKAAAAGGSTFVPPMMIPHKSFLPFTVNRNG